MKSPITALRTYVEHQKLKHQAAKPENLIDHALYLLDRQAKGKDGPLYVKRGGVFGLGPKRLSSQAPWIDKKKASKAYQDLLGQTALNNLDTNGATTQAGLAAQNLSVVRQRVPANQQQAAAQTKELAQLVVDLAMKKNEIDKSAEDKVLISALHTKKSTPLVVKPKISVAPANTQEDLPKFPTGAELDKFHDDLQREKIQRPALADVTRFVMHLNRTQGTTSNREFPPGELNEVNDLLTFITTGVTAKHTWKDGQLQVSRQTNTLNGHTFDNRLDAAEYLFTKTNFFKHLNISDVSFYMGIYRGLIKEAKDTQRKQQRVD